MQDRKLEQVLDVYFQDEPDKGSKEFQEAQKYLKLRIRPAMEFLIEKEDTDRMYHIHLDCMGACHDSFSMRRLAGPDNFIGNTAVLQF